VVQVHLFTHKAAADSTSHTVTGRYGSSRVARGLDDRISCSIQVNTAD